MRICFRAQSPTRLHAYPKVGGLPFSISRGQRNPRDLLYTYVMEMAARFECKGGGLTLGREDPERDGGSDLAMNIFEERALARSKEHKKRRRELKRLEKEKRARREAEQSAHLQAGEEQKQGKDIPESKSESESEESESESEEDVKIILGKEEEEEKRREEEDLLRREMAFLDYVAGLFAKLPPGTLPYRGDRIFREDVEFNDYSIDVCLKFVGREVLRPIENSTQAAITSKVCYRPGAINPTLQLSIRGFTPSAVENAKAKIMQAIEEAAVVLAPSTPPIVENPN